MNSNPYRIAYESIPLVIKRKILNHYTNDGIVFVSHEIPVKRKFCFTDHNITCVETSDEFAVPLKLDSPYWGGENRYRIYLFIHQSKDDLILLPVDYFNGLRFFHSSGVSLNIIWLKMSYGLEVNPDSFDFYHRFTIDFYYNLREKISLSLFIEGDKILKYKIKLYGKEFLFYDLKQLFFEEINLNVMHRIPIVCRWDGAK